MKQKNNILTIVFIVILFSCQPDKDNIFSTSPYVLEIPNHFPTINNSEDITLEGVNLGRKLFYDPILSDADKISCASCHIQSLAFSEPQALSMGVNGDLTNRNSMNLFNLNWQNNFFWDGRVSSLEEQAIETVSSHIEMNGSWEIISYKLNSHPEYPNLFKSAFNIDDIDSNYVVKAIGQFEKTLISGNSKFDKFYRGELIFSDTELRGWDLFNLDGPYDGADCFHCHQAPLFTDNIFHNNGLDSDENFNDLGLYLVTQNSSDKAKFKTPSLRNIELTPPYMHDGRFQTLDEVIEHYNFGGHISSTIDPLMKNLGEGLLLNQSDKDALKAFLLTLTDEEFINNLNHSDPNYN